MTFSDSVCVRARAASSKGTVSSVPTRFRTDSGTNLFEQGEIVAGRPCGSVAQLASARTVCERSWVRVPVGPCAFSSFVAHGCFNDHDGKGIWTSRDKIQFYYFPYLMHK